MTDPERITQRSSGLAAELLRAGAAEQPRSAGMERTLAALGVSGALLTTAATASGAAAGAGAAAGTGAAGVVGAATGAKAVKAMSAVLLVKWIGVGVVGGVGVAGAAAVVSAPAEAPPAAKPVVTSVSRAPAHAEPLAAERVTPLREETPPPAAAEPPIVATPPVAPAASQPATLDVGAPLGAEVAFIDRARSLLAAGQAEQGLALLRGYEQQFPEARLLPEVLFLRLETCDRLGRAAEARSAAQRLVDGFPKSPHAARARQLLEP